MTHESKHTADKRKIKLAHLAYLRRKKEAGRGLTINQMKAAKLTLTGRELKELRRG